MLDHRNFIVSFMIFIVLSAGIMTGCGNDGIGKLKLQITDTPYPFDLIEKAEVTIDKVDVHVSKNSAATSGFLTVAEGTVQTFNLLDLQGGVTATLVDANLDAGTYDQIRLRVSSASVELTDGRSFDLTIPSGSQSGIKVFPDPPIVVEDGLTTDLILDFDVSQSFNPIPNSPTKASEIKDFHFKPVIRVVNASSVGSISGSIYSDEGSPGDTSDDQPLEDAVLTAFEGTTLITTSSSLSDGRYVLMGIPKGNYDVTASKNGYVSGTTTGINVNAANNTGGVDLTLDKE